jgi:succinate dehydrogenase/fumarate reductase flavoprotein subunit
MKRPLFQSRWDATRPLITTANDDGVRESGDVMAESAKPPRSAKNFDETYDVVVVGYGYSGAISALEAARSGAQVLLVEKSAVPGGISICSYGAVRSASDAAKAYQYLTVTNGGRTGDDVVRAMANGMTEMEGYVRDLAKANDAEIQTTEEYGKHGANYPLPGMESFYHTTVVGVPNFSARAVYPSANGAPGGPMLFKIVEDNLASHRNGIEVRMQTEALRLIADGSEVMGVTLRNGGGVSRVRAKKGVVLACGGFEGNSAMQEQFWEGKPILPCAARNNSGDGIKMAQDLGAAIWHMWHFHGAYGFKHVDPDYPYAIRVKRLPDWVPGNERTANVKMAWILLDRSGNRFMNEYQPYTQDTAHRPLHYFDPTIQAYPRIPGFFLCDENGRKLYPLGRPTSNDADLYYEWSEDNMKEVESGILKQAKSLSALAETLGAPPAAVEAAVARWNAHCAAGRDGDFGRPPGTMVPIDTPPFYGAQMWPVCSNTQGGPVHDGQQRIIDVYNEPIPNLFAAGEMGSAFGHLYLSGGNIAECFITGRIAGRNAARGI